LAQARPEQAGPQSIPAAERHAYGWFVAGVGSWFGAWGMQHVLFSWLVVGELRENPASVGLAQMFQMLPAVGLMLFGGAIGDRLDRRRILLAAHAAAALAALAMSRIVASGQLTFGIVIAYAVCWGTFQSFVLPARDATLPDVAGSDLERGVTGMTLIQFSAQAIGSAAVRGAGVIGSAGALGVQAAVAALGLYPVSKLRLAPPHGHRAARPPILREIREGLREVWQSRALRPLAGLVACNGVFFVGPYFVLYPLIVRDVYGADLGDLALVMTMFPVGMIAGSSLLLRRGGIRRKGQALLLGFVGGGLALIATSLGLPFWGLLASVFGWGLAAAVFINMSRTLFQVWAPPSHRARVLSVYSLGLMGGAPLGNVAAGLLAEWLGPLPACALAGASMLAVIAYAWRFSEVRRME
jgi:MFS family permease